MQHLAEDAARQHAPLDRVPRLQHAEDRRRDDGAGHHEPAQPDDQREYVEVAEEAHLFSLLINFRPSSRANIPFWTPCLQVEASLLSSLKNIATRLRIESIRATTASASGHPTTCMSAADLMAALFFAEMRFDPKTPQHPEADRLVLSKGHAAPLLYAMWAEAGFIPRERLTDLRLFTSNLEGHPTPRLPFVDVATGSLGQGLAPASAARSTPGASARLPDLRADG